MCMTTISSPFVASVFACAGISLCEDAINQAHGETSMKIITLTAAFAIVAPFAFVTLAQAAQMFAG